MRLHATAQAPLLEICCLVERTAPAVQALLKRVFPACGATLCPDHLGHVRLAEQRVKASDIASREYGHTSLRLHALATSFSQALTGQAHGAGILLAKERPMLSCALDVARHPLDKVRRKTLAARILPAPPSWHRHDDATACCIWFRLWTLHAWILELMLAADLSGEISASEIVVLDVLDRQFSELTAANALWLSVAISGGAAPTFVLARAPAEAMAVGNLLWPDRLGARRIAQVEPIDAARRAGGAISGEDGSLWLARGTRYAEIPALDTMRHAA